MGLTIASIRAMLIAHSAKAFMPVWQKWFADP